MTETLFGCIIPRTAEPQAIGPSLVFCHGDSLTKSLELVEDFVCRGGSDEGLGAGIIILDEGVDFGDKIFDGCE